MNLKRGNNGDLPPSKKPHPFFTGQVQSLGTFLPSPPTLIHFLHLDPFAGPSGSTSKSIIERPSIETAKSLASTSVLSDSLPKSVPKIPIVFYDLDGTLIKPTSNSRFPKDRNDWTWWHANVLPTLKAEHEAGKHLIVISNQGDSRPKVRNEWKAKLSILAEKMPKDVPIRILAALDMYDVYRKPNIGMYQTVEALYKKEGYGIDVEKSVFVGDAAGRAAHGGKAKDHGDTDYKFALNVGLKFVTPEEHFLGESQPEYPRPPIGFKPSRLAKLGSLPPIVPSHTPIARKEIEIVLFVGPPAAGKTSFYRRYFYPRYEHVNQDTLRSRDNCLRSADSWIKAGRSVVVDNTNRNRATRGYWIALASKLNVPIRLFHFLCPLDLAKHNNVYRVCYGPKDDPPRTLLPLSAFSSYQNDSETPSMEEGFDEIRNVNFVFEGTDEQRALWDMYMLDLKR